MTTWPSSVGTSMLAPSTAWGNEIGIDTKMSAPSRWNSEWSLTLMLI